METKMARNQEVAKLLPSKKQRTFAKEPYFATKSTSRQTTKTTSPSCWWSLSTNIYRYNTTKKEEININTHIYM
jgi:hypothetical protein